MDKNNKNTVICIVGPTASGKTSLGIELAKKINGEIISADSMQIYKDLDIATAKVTDKEAQGIKHHLINICDVNEKFSVADFKKMCYGKINEILKKRKTPIIVGGTGLYINAVVLDMKFTKEKIDTKYRDKLYKLAKENSNMYVYNMLQEIDEQAAKEIHPNNLKRVIRALEIANQANKLKSEHIVEEQERIKELKSNSKYNFLVFYIDINREELYNRINNRVDAMINNGLVEEARKVYNMHLPNDATCMQAIGYKEFFGYFEGKINLEEAIEKLKIETRKYAKRQETWFRNKLDVIKLNGSKDKNKLLDDIISYI